MFGFSFAELILVLLVILFFIKPQDLPEIARFIVKTIFHAKKLYNEAKDSLKQLEKEFEIDNLKQEFNQAITEEEIKHHEAECDKVQSAKNERDVLRARISGQKQRLQDLGGTP
jgi:Sec-independent protein translocase protein TatA